MSVFWIFCVCLTVVYIIYYTVLICSDLYGEWKYVAEYYAAAGVTIPYDEWDPFLPVPEQEAKGKAVAGPRW